MDHRYTIGGITLDAVPELAATSEMRGELAGTLGGGAIRWQGGLRDTIVLRGLGLLESERTTLQAALEAADAITLETLEETWSVVLTSLHVEPLLGTDRYRYVLEMMAIG